MKRLKISAYFAFISVFTFVVAFILIVQKSYIDLIKPLNKVTQTKITPLNPKLDLDIVSEIEKRQDNSDTVTNSSPSSTTSFIP